jgi:hypothetical protein
MSDLEVLKEVVGLLNAWGAPYWLARGRFHYYKLTRGKFGEHPSSDIDFHIHRDDLDSLKDLLRARYEIHEAPHKVFIKVGDKLVEFMILKPNPAKKGFLYHETVVPKQTRPSCPANVFKEKRVEIGGVSVRIPETRYLSCVYGKYWRTYRK